MKRIIILLLLIAIVVIAALTVRHAKQPEPAVTAVASEVVAPKGALAKDYAGARSCAACHQEIYEQQSHSHMANALKTVEEFQRVKGPLPEGTVHDRVNNIDYHIVRAADGLSLRVSRGSESTELPMHYALGSGANGISFLHELTGAVLELRVSFYPETNDWDLTPGQVDLRSIDTDGVHPPALHQTGGRRFAKQSSDNCLNCHTTLLAYTEDRVDRAGSHFGVTCERCHGPGREHVEAELQGISHPPRNWQVEADLNRLNLDSPDPAVRATKREMRLCGECHGGSKTDAEDMQLSRFHVAALMASKCYAQVPAMLRCTDCHDPHGSAIRGDAEPYNQVCLACHGDPADQATKRVHPAQPGPDRLKQFTFSGRVCTVESRGDCIRCHMPRRHPLYRSNFTLHRIAIHDPNAEIFGPDYKLLSPTGF
jgi:predicted CXXCH cytochrome family protein